MNKIFSLIGSRKEHLANHSFCQYLRTANPSDTSVFSFVPLMSFFVLGFKDLLEYMRVPFPSNQVEHLLNEHCAEDSDHWMWFLQDLETLKLSTRAWGGKKISDNLQLIWSPQNAATRRQIYDIVILINHCKNAHEKLILIECMEAAFAAFIENLNVLTKRMGVYTELVYFGEHHYDKESDHTMGSWLDTAAPKTAMPHQARHAIRYAAMEQMIDDIFNGFESMFSCWEMGIEQLSDTQDRTAWVR